MYSLIPLPNSTVIIIAYRFSIVEKNNAVIVVLKSIVHKLVLYIIEIINVYAIIWNRMLTAKLGTKGRIIKVASSIKIIETVIFIIFFLFGFKWLSLLPAIYKIRIVFKAASGNDKNNNIPILTINLYNTPL